MRFCERWAFGEDDLKEWLEVPPFLFVLFNSERFNDMPLARQKQALLSQSIADKNSYGLGKDFVERERRLCVGYLNGEVTAEEPEKGAELADLWRLRKFNYDRYIKRRNAMAPPRNVTRAISIGSAHPIDKKLDELEGTDESDMEERTEEPKKVRHTLLAMALADPHQHVCVRCFLCGTKV